MNTIASILDDFYTCSKSPIKAVDKSLNLICSKGYNEDFEKLYTSIDFISNILRFENNTTPVNINVKNNVFFTMISISKFNMNKGYYIIGPYTKEISNTNLHEHIPCLPMNCINYLISLLLHINDDKFSKGRINLSVNLYVKRAVEYTMKNYTSDITVDILCKELNINKSYFCKLFKEDTGYTYSNYLNIFRIEKSKKLLLNTNMSLLDIAIAVGFNSQNYFTMVFKKITNMTPTVYRSENNI
ncbi:MAG: helix-turn-helix transcriptional regulator [Peptostreptococcaceae bacterium]